MLVEMGRMEYPKAGVHEQPSNDSQVDHVDCHQCIHHRLPFGPVIDTSCCWARDATLKVQFNKLRYAEINRYLQTELADRGTCKANRVPPLPLERMDLGVF